MSSISSNVTVLHHSCIKVNGSKVVYIDPFEIEGEPHDADLVLVTHDHYDHYSPEDIKKVKKFGTRLVVPQCMKEKVEDELLTDVRLHGIVPGGVKETINLFVEAVPAYNKIKPFHPKRSGYVGYKFELDGVWYFVAGDTDINDENIKVKCDIALLPVGGKYTMDAKRAAELANIIRPLVAIPTHYGSVVGSRDDALSFAARVEPPVKVEIKMEKE